MTTDDAALEAVESCRPTGPGQPLFTRREFAGACGSGLVGMAAAAGPAVAAWARKAASVMTPSIRAIR